MAAMSRSSTLRQAQERHLQSAGFDQSLDRRGAQRGDEVEPGRFDLFVDAGLSDHAVPGLDPGIADEHDMAKVEALFQFVDLHGKRARIGGVVGEDFDRDGASIGRAQEPIDDLQFALLAVATVTAFCELAAAPFDIARRDVIKDERSILQIFARQRRLDRLLAFAEPIESGVEFVFIDRAESENGAETRSRGFGIEHAGRRKFRGGCDESRDDHGDDEIAAAIARGSEDAIETDAAQRAENGRDMAVRQRAAQANGLFVGRQCDFAAFEQDAQTLDDFARPIGEIGDGAFFDFALVAEGLAQEDGGRRVAVGD
jgi:hypothetical protein